MKAFTRYWFDHVPAVKDAVNRAFHHALDGRQSVTELFPCEKTVIGVLVERYLRQNLGVRHGGRIADIQLPCGTYVDIKFSLHGQWMIPPNHTNQWLLLIRADGEGKFECGLLKCKESYLNPGHNRDRKRTLNGHARRQIVWLT